MSNHAVLSHALSILLIRVRFYDLSIPTYDMTGTPFSSYADLSVCWTERDRFSGTIYPFLGFSPLLLLNPLVLIVYSNGAEDYGSRVMMRMDFVKQ